MSTRVERFFKKDGAYILGGAGTVEHAVATSDKASEIRDTIAEYQDVDPLLIDEDYVREWLAEPLRRIVKERRNRIARETVSVDLSDPLG